MSDPRSEPSAGASAAAPVAEPDPAWLTGLPPAVRGHPLFRQGYNLGYSHRAREEPRPASRTGSGPAPPAPPDPPAIFNVTAGGLRHRLAPGVQALRDLTVLASGHLRTETPCCGRHLTLPTPGEDQTRPAFCCRCRILYAVVLTQEEPDGFGGEPPLIAVFTVQQVDVAITQHRTGKWERHPGKP